MARLFSAVFFLFSFLSVDAQQISVESFRLLENDLDARVNHPRRDQNGELSAIIKVVTTQTGFEWEPDGLGIVAAERKTGEYWLYVPRGAQRLTIKHPQLGVLRNYRYPIPIQSAMVYELVLVSARVTTIVEETVVPTQWLVITTEPDGADVYINDQLRGQTPFQMEFEVGDYSYRLEKLLYHPEAGRVNISADSRKTLNMTLRPNFGYIRVNTTPESGATVSVNGSPLPTASPVTTGMLRSGVYTIEAGKQLFHSLSRQVTVTDGQTIEVTLEMSPAFGGISVITLPEPGAEVLLNGNPTGRTTPATLERLPRGEHTITVRKEWYQPVTERVTVIDGSEQELTITLQPTFGNVNITAEADATIYIAGERRGVSSWEGRLVAGWYTIEARKDNYHSDTQRLLVEVGQDHQLSLHPKPMHGELRIVTDPFDADISLNGIDYGTTPSTIRNLLVGRYTLTLTRSGYGAVTRTITIEEGKTTEVNEALPSGMEVTITSTPSGADLYINDFSYGKTPFTGELAFGSYRLRLINQTKTVEETIAIWQGGQNRFSFNVALFSCGDDATFIYRGQTVTYGTVEGQNGTCWMDRNLGALRVARRSRDRRAYGDLFQWGRGDDGHQLRNSNTSSTRSHSDNPGHSSFITASESPYDWRSPQNDNLWQGDGGINDVCPAGWRVPTDAELNNEGQSWGSYDRAGAFASPLKLVAGGYRSSNGSLSNVGGNGYYWSSSVGGSFARSWYFNTTNAYMGSGYRVVGRSIRCIRND